MDAISYFFFQAEDGIRDVAVTGVQTCALPISRDLNQRFDHCSVSAHRGAGRARPLSVQRGGGGGREDRPATSGLRLLMYRGMFPRHFPPWLDHCAAVLLAVQ